MRNSMPQLQEAYAQSVQDARTLNIEHERARMQLRKNLDDERGKLSVAEAAATHWQQRYEAAFGMLQTEQQQRQRDNQSAVSDRQRLANEQWRLESSESQLKSQLESSLRRCEELARAVEMERESGAKLRTELTSGHDIEMLRLKKVLGEMQGAKGDLQHDLEALQQRLQQIEQDHDFEKGILAASIEGLQNNVEMLQKQLLVHATVTTIYIFVILTTHTFSYPKTQPTPPLRECVTSTPSASTRSAAAAGVPHTRTGLIRFSATRVLNFSRLLQRT